LLTYPASIPLSTRSLTHLTSMIAEHRTVIGSRWRRLSAGRQALLVLAHLRNCEYGEAASAGGLTRCATGRVPCRRTVVR
jgi:hypothetical protein